MHLGNKMKHLAGKTDRGGKSQLGAQTGDLAACGPALGL